MLMTYSNMTFRMPLRLGCGKTTQVPQLVLDAMIDRGEGALANMIVTQPRRISAVGVSERMAAERCERIGDTVGYSIRLETKRSARTRLLAMTTGVLLRRLQCDPLLDTVRSLPTSFLLLFSSLNLQSKELIQKIVTQVVAPLILFFSKYFICSTPSAKLFFRF